VKRPPKALLCNDAAGVSLFELLRQVSEVVAVHLFGERALGRSPLWSRYLTVTSLLAAFWASPQIRWQAADPRLQHRDLRNFQPARPVSSWP
jgi:hypothetical protein